MKMLVTEPGRPRLTWYGPQGERVELSGAVLQNWVSKTVNLLVEEFDAAPGVRVKFDLPLHWRTIVWALGVWRCGATVVLAGPEAAEPPTDVVLTGRPDAWEGTGPELVAVSLPALARRFDGELPAGAIDAAAAVMTYGDVVAWAPETDVRAAALEAPGTDPVHFADLVPVGGDVEPGARVLVDGAESTAHTLRTLLGVWAAGGSVVLVERDTMAELRTDAPRLARLRETERVTG
jgi:uncharacterized protein (TIGR03089 family)